MKQLRYLYIAALTAAALLAGCAGSGQGSGERETVIQTTAAQESQKETAAPAKEDDGSAQGLTGLHHVKIVIKDYGTVTAELDGDNAPVSTGNFLNLAKKGFYNGLTFHRIIEGFMIQGGDPMGNGQGGSGAYIKGEFAANGVDNPLRHTRGALAMARSREMDSASSQFFIVQEDSPHLDGNYAVFGYVTEGMDVVDAICQDANPVDNNGTITPEEQPEIVSIEVID